MTKRLRDKRNRIDGQEWIDFWNDWETAMEDYRATDFYKNMTAYHACECAERFGSGENAGKDETLAAWQYIYDQGMHHYLQGFYGRTLEALIEQGLINTKEN